MINLLAQAIHADELDDAVSLLQTALGIETGDVAAIVFSELPKGDDSWLDLSTDERRKWLAKWLAAEFDYA
jgi:hypothetical protein